MELTPGQIFSNTTFDFDVLKRVLKKNWYWCIIFFGLFLSLAFVYLRYTVPVFEAKTIIQVNSENQTAEIFDLKDFRTTQWIDEKALSKEIELLRSKLLFQKVLKELPLEVSHFAKGEFLTEERYRTGNFFIDLIYLSDSSLYNRSIYLGTQGEEVELTFESQKGKQVFTCKPNSVLSTEFFDIEVNITNWDAFQRDAGQNQLYFKFNDIGTLYRTLHPNLSIQGLDYNARTVAIIFEHPSALLAEDITISLANQFFKYYEDLKKEGAENVLEFISVQLDSLNVELTKAKNDVADFKRKENINSLKDYSESVFSKINSLKAVETGIYDELETLDIIKRKIKDETQSIEIYRLLPILMGKTYESSLSSQINGLYTLVEQKENLLFKVTPDNEAVKRIDERIQLRKDIIYDIMEALNARSNDKLMVIQEKIAEEELKYNLVPEKQMELERLLNIQSVNEKYFNLLTEKKVLYSISNAGYSSDNKILEEAGVSTVPISPKRWLIYGVANFLAIMMSLGFLALRYVTFNNITQQNDLKKLIPEYAGFLGAIPFRDLKGETSPLIVNKYPKSSIAESFRNLRINLSFIKKNVRTISMTSTISQEGKTFVVLNLAGVIAMAGKKVVIVDLDMRKPKIHLAFNTRNHKGMSNLLAGQCELDEVVNHSEIEGLDFITSGPIPPNPSELLLREEFEKTVDELKKKYDTVIFDNPPIGLVSDGIPLLNKVDVPIYTFRANRSKRFFVDSLKALIVQKKLKNIYVVLNGTEKVKSSYGKKYGYGGYGYGYYVED